MYNCFNHVERLIDKVLKLVREITIADEKVLTQILIFLLRLNRRFHQIEMSSPVVWTVFLVYIAQNVCFCDDPTGPVTAGVVASAESTKSSTAPPPKVFVSPEKYRLPRTVLPEFYKLNIFTHINDDEGFKFYGDVRIKVHTHAIYVFFVYILFVSSGYWLRSVHIHSYIDLNAVIFDFAKNVDSKIKTQKNEEIRTKRPSVGYLNLEKKF